MLKKFEDAVKKKRENFFCIFCTALHLQGVVALKKMATTFLSSLVEASFRVLPNDPSRPPLENRAVSPFDVREKVRTQIQPSI